MVSAFHAVVVELQSSGRDETPSEIGYEGINLFLEATVEIVWQK
jgi:hypothetical protein